jgi:hypothetical protein
VLANDEMPQAFPGRILNRGRHITLFLSYPSRPLNDLAFSGSAQAPSATTRELDSNRLNELAPDPDGIDFPDEVGYPLRLAFQVYVEVSRAPRMNDLATERVRAIDHRHGSRVIRQYLANSASERLTNGLGSQLVHTSAKGPLDVACEPGYLLQSLKAAIHELANLITQR